MDECFLLRLSLIQNMNKYDKDKKKREKKISDPTRKSFYRMNYYNKVYINKRDFSRGEYNIALFCFCVNMHVYIYQLSPW
jgi:hypothetical protein